MTSLEYVAALPVRKDDGNFGGQPRRKIGVVLMRNVALIGELGNTDRKLVSLVPRSSS
jgi:hypothetical protein